LRCLAQASAPAVADFNGDGKLDIVVTALSAPAEIWINDSPGNNHGSIFRFGTKSNRDGIGARSAHRGGKGAIQYMTTQAAMLPRVPCRFTSAWETRASPARSRSLASGTVQKIENVAADRVLQVKEPR